MRDVQVFEGDDPKDWTGYNTHGTAPPEFRFIPPPLDCRTLYNMRMMMREGLHSNDPNFSLARGIFTKLRRNVGVDLIAAFSHL